MSEEDLQPGPIQLPDRSIELSWLRDQFAMAALTGVIARGAWDKNDFDVIARDCYAQSDAMLKAREK